MIFLGHTMCGSWGVKRPQLPNPDTVASTSREANVSHVGQRALQGQP